MAIYSIYKITNLVNGKVYIGQTSKDPENRFALHIHNSKTSPKFAIHKAMAKYGIESFKFEVIFNVFLIEDLNFYEIHFIMDHESYGKGYNMTCPHCNKEGKGPAMFAWHFDKCKFKPQ